MFTRCLLWFAETISCYYIGKWAKVRGGIRYKSNPKCSCQKYVVEIPISIGGTTAHLIGSGRGDLKYQVSILGGLQSLCLNVLTEEPFILERHKTTSSSLWAEGKLKAALGIWHIRNYPLQEQGKYKGERSQWITKGWHHRCFILTR